MKNYHFFAFISKCKHINRFGLMRNLRNDNLMEHSYEVSVIAGAIANIGNIYFEKNYNPEKIMSIALFHDSSEIITGDLPTPIKYFNKDIKTAYKNIEKVAEEKLLSMLPAEMTEKYSQYFNGANESEIKIIKAADKISAFLKCVDEIKMGNGDFTKAKEQILIEIEKLDLEEVKYFMDTFIDSFELTLDELN